MNQEIKDKWIDALRSGVYKQTKGVLHDANGYCCLGVLCDLHAKETGNTWHTECAQTNICSYLENTEVLPTKVRKWAGLTDDCGEFVQNINDNWSLTEANDSGEDFNKIACYIEENF